jgi:hypothetical protein
MAQGIATATLTKILNPNDQTLEDGQKDNRLRDDLTARVVAAGLYTDKSSDGSSGSAGKTG